MPAVEASAATRGQHVPVTPEHLQWIVDDAFSAPTDGAAERARGGIERAISDWGLGWLAARRLRREAEPLIAARMREITPPGA